MANSSTYQLKILLTLSDRLSSGLDKNVTKLRGFDGQAKATIQTVNALNKALGNTSGGKPIVPRLPREPKTGNGGARTSATEELKVQREKNRLLFEQARDQSRLQAEQHRLTREETRTKTDGAARNTRALREEVKLKQDSVRLRQSEFRLSSSGELHDLRLLREKFNLKRAYMRMRRDEAGVDDIRVPFLTGAAGLATLGFVRGGLREAGDFQSSMSDLRTSIIRLGGDGKVNVSQLTGEMSKLESISVRLGNQLPGTTDQFVRGFIAARQGGMDARTMIEGAGEALSNLSVVMGVLPEEVGTPLARFGQQFGLKGREFTDLADLMARARGATGADPMDLIQATKYFAPRAASPLGITGATGAQQTVQMLSLLNRKGIVGEQAGTNLSAFFSRMTMQTKPQQKALAELRKKGINLEFFDKQKNFMGDENVFAQLEKLRSLKDEQRLSVMERLFEREGMGVADVFSKAGVQGYRDSNKELQSILPLQEQINQKTATYNAKIESLSGTLSNLKVTVFTPLLEPLGSAADKANVLVGNLQEFSKAHPDVSKQAVTLVAYAGAAITVASGIKAMTTAWKLWQLASDVSRMRDPFDPVVSGARRGGLAVDQVNTKVGRLRGGLNSIAANPFKIVMALEIAGYTIGQIMELMRWFEENKKTQANLIDSAKLGDRASDRFIESQREAGKPIPNSEYSDTAKRVLETLQGGVERPAKDPIFGSIPIPFAKAGGRQLELGLMPERKGYYRQMFEPANPYTNKGDEASVEYLGVYEQMLKKRGDLFERAQAYKSRGLSERAAMMRVADEEKAVPLMRERAPELKRPEVLAEVRKAFEQLKPTDEARDRFNNMLKLINPDGFAKSQQELSLQAAQLSQNFLDLLAPTGRLPESLTRVTNSLDSAASHISNLRFDDAPISIGAPMGGRTFGMGQPGQSVARPSPFPKLATGGFVDRAGGAIIHDDEAIIPARVTRRWRDGDFAGEPNYSAFSRRQPAPVYVTYSPSLTLQIEGAGSDMDIAAIKGEVQRLLDEHTARVPEIVATAWQKEQARA